MRIAIVKYNAGNIGSVANALDRIGCPWFLTDDPVELQQADKVVFPGVGEASTTMRYLDETGLGRVIATLSQPVLGICLGLQLMCDRTEEGNTTALGIFPVPVRRFAGPVKVPHMGWNAISFEPAGLFRGLTSGCYVYFVHSYYAETGAYTLATTDYGIRFSAALHYRNFYAVQFHPEKSGMIGQVILQNFIDL